MKYTIIAAITASVFADQVPIEPHLPGWHLGTTGAQVQIRMFYDMLCPLSKKAHYAWKSLLPKQSPIPNKTYADIVDVHVSPIPWPWHLHSYTMSKLFPLLEDMCQANKDQCYQDSYAELCWDHLDFSTLKGVSEGDFIQNYAQLVHETFPAISELDIFGVYTKNDTHRSERRLRNYFDYAASIGVFGTPSAFINGVKVTDVPLDEAGWEALMKQVLESSNNSAIY